MLQLADGKDFVAAAAWSLPSCPGWRFAAVGFRAERRPSGGTRRFAAVGFRAERRPSGGTRRFAAVGFRAERRPSGRDAGTG